MLDKDWDFIKKRGPSYVIAVAGYSPCPMAGVRIKVQGLAEAWQAALGGKDN
jgi:hypothetical protein